MKELLYIKTRDLALCLLDKVNTSRTPWLFMQLARIANGLNDRAFKVYRAELLRNLEQLKAVNKKLQEDG